MDEDPVEVGKIERPKRRLPPMLYQNEYVWFVFLAAMDILLTWAIITADGTEVNPIASWVIDRWELPGTILFKFGLTLFVILVCEASGRKRRLTGLVLARSAVVVSALPVAYSLALLSWHVLVQL